MKFKSGLAVGVSLSFLFAYSQDPKPIPGFAPGSLAVQRELEGKLKSLPRAENARRNHLRLTEDPHVAGTPGGKAVADFIHSEFKRYGVPVEMVEYDVLLSYPETVDVRMVRPIEVELANPEEGYDGDKDSFDSRVDPPWHAYAASGEVTSQVVYVNYGRAEDYDRLERLGIDVRGKIALARYFKGYRGGKSLEAERRGVAALIIYSDPADDGYVQGDVYPSGPWGPGSHVQRGANVYDFKVPGDPLTPGWASTKGARRIAEEESEILPKIPTLPLSSDDASNILENLAGVAAGAEWQGGLPFTYHLGPGPAEVSVDLEITRERRTIYDIIGRIEGSEEPDQFVILSNHHDAWVYGGVDPSSGTASLLELARVFGQLSAEGWKPRRTLILAAWDAEEYTLTGSTEWGEENAEAMRRGAVACLNVDASTSGGLFSASAVPSLRRFIIDVARDIGDPGGERSVFEKWAASRDGGNIRGYAVNVESRLPVDIGILGSGSDYTVFFNFLGVPSVDMLFDGPYGVYHSQYDNHAWMSRFGDPGFRYHRTMSSLWGVMAVRLANADLLPFDYEEYGRDLALYVKDLEPLAADHLDLKPLRDAVDAFTEAAVQAAQRTEKMLTEGADRARLKKFNEALMKVERDFTVAEGIPGRPWFKHLIYAPLPSYQAETLPGVREALVEKDWTRAERQRDVLVAAVRRAAATLEGIR